MIYFIQEKGLFKNRIKIGYSEKNTEERLRLIQSQSPTALKVLFVISGDKQDESDYHNLFAAYRLHGEWFRYGLRLRFFVWMNRFGMNKLFKPAIDVPLPQTQKPSLPRSAFYLLANGLFELILGKIVGRYSDIPDPLNNDQDPFNDEQYNDDYDFEKAWKEYEVIIKKMKSQKIRDWIRRTAWPDEIPVSEKIYIDWDSFRPFEEIEEKGGFIFDDNEFGGES